MRVLLLEDDPSHAANLTRELIARGCEVISETDGAQGLVRAVSEPFDAVIVSVDMPGMDGFRVCTRLEQEPATRALHVLLIGNDAEVDERRMLPIRADAYLERPARADDVLSIIRVPRVPRVLRSETAERLPSPVRTKSGTAFARLRGTLAAHLRTAPVPAESALATDLVVAKSRARALEELLAERQSMVGELEHANRSARVEREQALRRADELAKKLTAMEASLDEAVALLREGGQKEADSRAAVVVAESEGRAEAERRAAALQIVSANEARAHAATRKELEALRQNHQDLVQKAEQAAAESAAQQRILLRRARDEHAELLRRVRRRHDGQRERHAADMTVLEGRVATQEARANEEIARFETAANEAMAQLRASMTADSAGTTDELASAHARARSLEQSLVVEKERRHDESAARERAVHELAVVSAERELESLDHASAVAELAERHEARIAEMRADLRTALARVDDVDAARAREIADLLENHARAVAELASATDAEKAIAIAALHEAEQIRHIDDLAALEQRYVEAAAQQKKENEEREAQFAERERRAIELQEVAETRVRVEMEGQTARALARLEDIHASTLAEVRVTLLNEAARSQAELERLQEDSSMAPALSARQRDADMKSRFKLDDGVRALRMELDRARRDADASIRASAAEVRALRTREENLVAEIARLKSRAEAKNAYLAGELEQARAANAAMSQDLAALEADAFRLSQNDSGRLKLQVEALQEECSRLRASFAMTEASLALAHQEETGALRAELEAAARDYAAELAKTRAAADRKQLQAVEEARMMLRFDLEAKSRIALEAAEAEWRARIDDEVAERREQWTRTLMTSQSQHDEEREALAGRVAELVGEVSELEAEISVLRSALVAARRKLDLPTPSTA